MNEASKAHIAEAQVALEGSEVDFDFGTRLGREAAAAAITTYLFDNPDSVTERPGIEAGKGS